MDLLNNNELKFIETDDNFIKYINKTAKFNTKIASDMKHNGEIIDVIGVIKGRDKEHDSYIVKFNDNTIVKNVMNIELQFDYIKDPVQEDVRRKLSKIINEYNLSNKEIEELQIAIMNYDYEANEGVVFTKIESIEDLFTDEKSQERINPSLKQLKAMAEYIKHTEKYYMLYGYEEYTEKVIDLILNKDENEIKITRIELLSEVKDMINHNIMCYSSNNSLGQAKKGYENEFARENKKLMLVEQMIKEEKQKEKRKNKEAR